MRYFLLCLLLASCALSPDKAQKMSQEDLCYTAGDATDKATYQAAINELNSRKLTCDKWLKHIVDRQNHRNREQPYDYLRCDNGDGTYVYCGTNTGIALITPLGPYPSSMFMITK
jgi:hypothetical protein